MACGCDPLPSPIQFIIGTTAGAPAAGTSVYYNTTLFARNYLIHRNIWGFLVPGVHYTISPIGGFQLISPDMFNTGETFTITFY